MRLAPLDQRGKIPWRVARARVKVSNSDLRLRRYSGTLSGRRATGDPGALYPGSGEGSDSAFDNLHFHFGKVGDRLLVKVQFPC